MMISDEEISEGELRHRKRLEQYQKYGYEPMKERRFVIDSAGSIKGNILEVGTGKGSMTGELASRGYVFTSIDIDALGQEIAKYYLSKKGLQDNVKFVLENAEKISFPDSCFDLIFCVNTLHHLRNSEKVLSELIRILKKGGRLVLSDFTEKTFKIMDDVHLSEGRTHDVVGWPMQKAKEYLNKIGMITSEMASEFQNIIIAEKIN